jgi:hypothetical protein
MANWGTLKNLWLGLARHQHQHQQMDRFGWAITVDLFMEVI